MQIPIIQVDAFTAEPFAGNPAAVCILSAPRPDAWMQQVAREMNLSETAFLVPREEGTSFDLRWFTPAAEVDLCGHATLASAHVLWEDGHLPAGTTAHFYTRSGLLTARQQDGWITMDFPARPAEETPAPERLAEALGAEPLYVGQNGMDYLALLSDARAVRALAPEMRLLAQVPARGVIVTAPAEEEGVDFVSRFFGPRVGVPEDPVTGSAHCCLGPFWQQRLGKDRLVGYQASARGGTVRVHVRGSRVDLAGRAVTVLRGRLTAGA